MRSHLFEVLLTKGHRLVAEVDEDPPHARHYCLVLSDEGPGEVIRSPTRSPGLPDRSPELDVQEATLLLMMKQLTGQGLATK